MKEIEVKFLEIDKNSVIERLKDKEAQKIFEGEIKAIYFDYPDGKLESKDKVLRLRKIGDKTELTYKSPSTNDSNMKIREEYTINSNNFEEAKNVLQGIDLKQIYSLEKYRESYALDQVRFEFDKFEEIPEYLEIEADSEEKIKEYAKMLDLSIDEAKDWPETKVLKNYNAY